jgi:solute carrier family 25, member 44
VPRYRGIFDAIRTIYREEGLRGLYKGYHISMLTQASVTALFFWL